MPIAFYELSLGALAGIFSISAIAVWLAGTRLTGDVAAIAAKTGIGQAFAGMLLLGGITSLPEVAAVSTAATVGNAPLAINNLIGSASINLILLAVADFIYGRGALTAVAARPAMLMQGVLSMLLATAVALVATIGDIAILGVGAGSAAIAAGAIVAMWLSSEFEHRHVWEAVGGAAGNNTEPGEVEDRDPRSIARLILLISASALVILTAGYLLVSSADAFATLTGADAGIVGFLVVGLATSLPEISSITAAIRLKRYQMAIGDVFGTNIFNVLLIFLADLFYREGPVLEETGQFEAVGAILAVMLTGIFLAGLIGRRDRTIFRMGHDSFVALLIFAFGVYLLSQMTGR